MGSVRVKASDLIAVLKVALAVDPAVTIEIRGIAPVVLRCETSSQKFTGLLMPLT